MSQFRVARFAGYQANERPLHFVICGRKLEVHKIASQWYCPEATYFRVRADDGNFYNLRHDDVQDLRTLDGFRAA